MKYVLISLALLMSGHTAWAQTTSAATSTAPATVSVKTTNDMADGEVRKVDKENKRITLKHGAIKNLDMPAMTMVFQVKDAAVLEKIKTGDKVRFRAEAAGGSAVVTDIEVAK